MGHRINVDLPDSEQANRWARRVARSGARKRCVSWCRWLTQARKRQIAPALLASVACLGLAGCGDPEIASLASRYAKNVRLAAPIVLHENAVRLETAVRTHADTEKEWLCFAAEKATYDEKTGHVTLPSEDEIEKGLEKKVVGLVLPEPRYRAALSSFYSTLQALDSEEFAKAVVDVGCAV